MKGRAAALCSSCLYPIPNPDKPPSPQREAGKPVSAKRFYKSRFIGEIPNHKYQIPNKSQHAAQAPALRVTEIQNPKRKYDLEGGK